MLIENLYDQSHIIEIFNRFSFITFHLFYAQ